MHVTKKLHSTFYKLESDKSTFNLFKEGNKYV